MKNFLKVFALVVMTMGVFSTSAQAAGVNDWTYGSGSGYAYKYNCNGTQDSVIVFIVNSQIDMTSLEAFYSGACYGGILMTDSKHNPTVDIDDPIVASLVDYLYAVDDDANIWLARFNYMRPISWFQD